MNTANLVAKRIAHGIVKISEPNENRDGSGTLYNLYTAPSDIDKAIIELISVKAINANSNGVVRVFLNNMSENLLIHEFVIEAKVPTNIARSFKKTVSNTSTEGFLIVVPSRFSIKVSSSRPDTFIVYAQGIEYLQS